MRLNELQHFVYFFLAIPVYFYTITQNNQTIKTDKLMVK